MKSLFIAALGLWSAGAMASTESEKTIFEQSAPHMKKFGLQVLAENQTTAVRSLLAILESDRPALKGLAVNTEGRELKVEAEAAEGSKTL